MTKAEKLRNELKAHLMVRIMNELTDPASRNPIRFILNHELDFIVDQLITVVYTYTRDQRKSEDEPTLMVEVITGVGNPIVRLRKKGRNSTLAAKVGAFLLWSLEDLGWVSTRLSRAKNGHATYIVELQEDKVLHELFGTVSVEKTEKLPYFEPPADWDGPRHPEVGIRLVKTGSRDILDRLNPEDQPMIFDCLNRAQKVGWRVNKQVLDLVRWAFTGREEAFNDIWEAANKQAQESKARETRTIIGIAERMGDNNFYHLYYYDFRGRKYPTTAYFHEQGMDASKGMLLRADAKRLGGDYDETYEVTHPETGEVFEFPAGVYWLLVSIASNWAGDSHIEGQKTDKIPRGERVRWCIDNFEVLLSYADSPKVNKGWMGADKPWQFISAVLELHRILGLRAEGHDWYDIESQVECYIDGSNNGCQHLSALTLDEVTAPHVNVTPQELPGDLYKYVADHVFDTVIEPAVSKMSSKERAKNIALVDNVLSLKTRIQAEPHKSDKRKELVEELLAIDKEELKEAAPCFWYKFNDPKKKRKIVKRNVMTLPYGGTRYGLGQQQIEDARKHGIDELAHFSTKCRASKVLGSWMGQAVFDACETAMERPMRLLEVFVKAGERADKDGRFLNWTVPITNFPVEQYYVTGTTKKRDITYGDEMRQLMVNHPEDSQPAKGKQAQAASPNCIHSFDAAHLVLTAVRADFVVTTVHDSFGCHLADMPKLFDLIRETFIEFYETDPLTGLLFELGVEDLMIEKGNLNIYDIRESEYAFV